MGDSYQNTLDQAEENRQEMLEDLDLAEENSPGGNSAVGGDVTTDGDLDSMLQNAGIETSESVDSSDDYDVSMFDLDESYRSDIESAFPIETGSESYENVVPSEQENVITSASGGYTLGAKPEEDPRSF